MADKKKDKKTPAKLPPRDMASDDDHEDVPPPGQAGSIREGSFTPENVEKFVLGEITWGELIGMSRDFQYGLARLAYDQYEQGKYHEARQMFEGLLVCNPFDSYFHTMLGATYQQLDMIEPALHHYAQAIELNPSSKNAFVNRGELMLQRGEFETALKDLRHAVSLAGTDEDRASVRARALLNAAEAAMQELDKLLAGRKNSGTAGSAQKPKK